MVVLNTTLNEELINNYRKEVYNKVKTKRIRNYYEKCLNKLMEFEYLNNNVNDKIDAFLINEFNISNVNVINIKGKTNYQKTSLRCLLTLKEYALTGNFKKFMTYKKNYDFLIEQDVLNDNRVPIFKNILSDIYYEQKEILGKTMIYEYSRFWYKFYIFLLDQKNDFSLENADTFLKKYVDVIPNGVKGLAYTQRTVLRAISLLKIKYENINYENIRYGKLENHYNISDNYEMHLKENNFSWRTIQTRILFSRRLLSFLEDNNIDICDLNIEYLNDYFSKYKHYKDKRSIYSTTRLFLKYLFDQEIIDNPLHLKIFNHRMPYPKTIPSVWEEENINKLLNGIDTNSPLGKRNYAILLISTTLGLRASDIFNLKFKNINWNGNYIEFNQSKTNGYVKLPLFSSVGNAIIDYLKNGRPNCELEYIFIRHKKPYKQLVTLYSTIEKYINNSNIEFRENQKKGMHSFRHTVGSNLLNKNIPIDTIAPILGHANINTTGIYLKCDKSKLISCFISLESDGKYV